MLDKNIVIVGMGLIGGSLAYSLRGKVKGITAIDCDERIIEQASALGIIDAGSTSTDLLEEANIVIICLYPKKVEEFIESNYDKLKGKLIIDVGGLKGATVDRCQKLIDTSSEFIGTHPMAGREAKGLNYAKKELFLGTNFIITPTENNTEKNISLVKEICGYLGVKSIDEMRPEEHDKMMGEVSHIPHILAWSMLFDFNTANKKYIGGSFKDATRVGKMNEDLWSELFIANKENLLAEIKTLKEKIEKMESAIRDENIDRIKEYIAKGRQIKEEIDR